VGVTAEACFLFKQKDLMFSAEIICRSKPGDTGANHSDSIHGLIHHYSEL